MRLPWYKWSDPKQELPSSIGKRRIADKELDAYLALPPDDTVLAAVRELIWRYQEMLLNDAGGIKGSDEDRKMREECMIGFGVLEDLAKSIEARRSAAFDGKQ